MYFNGKIFLYCNKSEVEKFKSYRGRRGRFFKAEELYIVKFSLHRNLSLESALANCYYALHHFTFFCFWNHMYSKSPQGSPLP